MKDELVKNMALKLDISFKYNEITMRKANE